MADEVIGEEVSRTQPIEKATEAKEELKNGQEIPLMPDEAAEEARKAEIRLQITKIEEEISTLKQALDRKEKHLADLKRELGITTWSQLRTGLENQYHNLQSTQMYNKLSQGAVATKNVLSDAGGKTVVAVKTASNATAKKLGEIRDSSMFQSLESKVISASSSIKEKVYGRSQSLDGDVNINKDAAAGGVTSPSTQS